LGDVGVLLHHPATVGGTAMKRIRKRKCLYCKEQFQVDVRNLKRQKCCRKTQCQRALKAAQQRRWLAKPENRNYFRGPENVARVRGWRKDNPGYSRRTKGQSRGRAEEAAGDALQEAHIAQVIDPTKDSGTLAPGAGALQEVLRAQGPVLIGLIAHLTDTLQEDIATTSQRLLQLGQDILSRKSPDAPQESAAP
jgi:hypothetical protein